MSFYDPDNEFELRFGRRSPYSEIATHQDSVDPRSKAVRTRRSDQVDSRLTRDSLDTLDTILRLWRKCTARFEKITVRRLRGRQKRRSAWHRWNVNCHANAWNPHQIAPAGASTSGHSRSQLDPNQRPQDVGFTPNR